MQAVDPHKGDAGGSKVVSKVSCRRLFTSQGTWYETWNHIPVCSSGEALELRDYLSTVW